MMEKMAAWSREPDEVPEGPPDELSLDVWDNPPDDELDELPEDDWTAEDEGLPEDDAPLDELDDPPSDEDDRFPEAPPFDPAPGLGEDVAPEGDPALELKGDPALDPEEEDPSPELVRSA